MIDLLIVFTDGTSVTIANVENTGYIDNMFYYNKNKRRTYIPRENVKLFGSVFDYLN